MALLKKSKKPSVARTSHAPVVPVQRAQPSRRPPVFDVVKPSHGNIAPQASSRPVLVTNTPEVADAMVTSRPSRKLAPPQEEPVVIDERQTAPTLTRPRKTVIQPLSHDMVEAAEAPQQITPVDTSEPIAPLELPTEITETEETATEAEIAEPEAPVTAVVEPEPVLPVEPVVPEDPEAAAASKQAEQALAAQKLVDSQQYFLPINAVQEKRTKRFVIVGGVLIVLLLGVWYNAALDAGLLDNSLNLPHTSFFSLNEA